MTAEGDLVRAALTYLEMVGVFAWRNNTGALKVGKRFIRFGHKGSGDILGVLSAGRMLSVECKIPPYDESDEQIEFKRDVLAAGGLAIVIRSLDDLEEALWVNRGKASNE